jgi:PAP2 superfamily protein
MHRTLNRVLFAVGSAVVLIDAGWLLLGHFAIDWQRYKILLVLALPLVGGAVYYERSRSEPALSAMLACAAFMIVFAAGASLASYLLITVAGPRIDGVLAEADAAIGFHWSPVMAFAADNPLFNRILGLAYVSVMPQTVLLLLWLGARGDLEDLYGLVLAVAYGAVITLAVWTPFPSFGAFSVFSLPDDVASRLNLVAGFDYAHDLLQMLQSGPGFISPSELRGIIGFPSYHTLQAVVLTWYARRNPVLRWPVLAVNAAVLVAIPIHGGHHLVDLLGGLFVAAVAIVMARVTVAAAARLAPAEAVVEAHPYAACK